MKHILHLPDGSTMEMSTPIPRPDRPINRLPDVFHVPFAGSSARLIRADEGPPVVYHPAPRSEQPAHLQAHLDKQGK